MCDTEIKENVYELQKFNLIGPQLTNTLLMLVLFLPSLFKEFKLSVYTLGLVVLIAASNCFTVLYFNRQLKKYDLNKYGNKTITKIQTTLCSLFFIFLILVTIKNIFFK